MIYGLHLPGSSLAGFTGALNDMSSSFGWNAVINQSLFAKTAAEFGYHSTKMNLLKEQDHMKDVFR